MQPPCLLVWRFPCSDKAQIRVYSPISLLKSLFFYGSGVVEKTYVSRAWLITCFSFDLRVLLMLFGSCIYLVYF